MRRFSIWFVMVLVLALVVGGGCMQAARVASKTVEAVGSVELKVASAGRDAYVAEVGAIEGAAVRKRTALGCAASGPCTAPGWAEYREEARLELDAAKARWKTFRAAMVSLNAALTETAIAVNVYLESDGGFDLDAAVAGLLKSWSVASALLAEYGVTPPKILGGGR
jgi:outer membrane lipoprotein-sorting protein